MLAGPAPVITPVDPRSAAEMLKAEVAVGRKDRRALLVCRCGVHADLHAVSARCRCGHQSGAHGPDGRCRARKCPCPKLDACPRFEQDPAYEFPPGYWEGNRVFPVLREGLPRGSRMAVSRGA